MGLPSLAMPVEEAQSYRVDENGAFVHGSINIGADGMRMTGSDTARAQPVPLGNSLSAEEAAELQALRKDTRLEDLEFLSKLGEGNSSVVHLAFDRRLKKHFAVKRINIYDRSKRHQIIKELHTLYKCDCPHLISFHGAFFKDGAISIALEWMDVGSLADVLQAVGCIPEAELCVMAKQVLEGLAYLRRKHKIHRDVKPSNICLNSAGHAKLSDFGITTSLDSTLAGANSFVGTSAYMSPERLMGQEYKYPADIWAIGLVLLECALGRFPYRLTGVYLDMLQSVVQGPSPEVPKSMVAPSAQAAVAAAASAAASSSPASPASHGSHTSAGVGPFTPHFANFIQCCLAKDPSARSTAEELLRHPWLETMSKLAPRTTQQMETWMTTVKQKMEDMRKRGAAGAGGGECAAMDTSTGTASAPFAASAGAAGSMHPNPVPPALDPFERLQAAGASGYNDTTTSGSTSAMQDQGRRNIPANASESSSFFAVKRID